MAPGESSEASGKQQHRPFMHRLRNPGHNGMIEEVMCQRSERANRTRFARCDDASDAKQLHYSVRILRYQQNGYAEPIDLWVDSELKAQTKLLESRSVR